MVCTASSGGAECYARAYANDAVFVDTTHKATSYNYKTGPPAVIDCFGHSAPCGMFQVPEEEIDSVADMMRFLELDVLGATCCTDGGHAWPEIAKKFRQFHIEDTIHGTTARMEIKRLPHYRTRVTGRSSVS